MKKTYRRAASAAILCILLFSLASCADPGSAPAPSSYTAPSSAAPFLPGAPDEAPITAAGDTAAENITAEELRFHAAAEGALTCTGYYEIIVRADGSGNIYYTDFDSLRKIVLCSRPECRHDDETCSGYLPCAANIPEIMAVSDFLILAYSGNPYFAELGDDALARIEIRGLNGENARTICKFDANVQLDFNFACSESKLFVFETTIGPGNSAPAKEVLQIDLSTGETKVLARFDCRSGENCYFVGAAEGKLFFKKSRVAEALLGGQSDGMLSTADITKALLFELFTIDPGSGETTAIRSWRSGETLQKIVGNSCFFINPGSVDRFDLNTHALKRVVSGQEFLSPDSAEQVYFADPYLVYSIHYPAGDPSDAVIKRFICNVETLELHESALTTSFRGIPDPVPILALTPQYLLVGCSIEEVPASEKAAYISSTKRTYAMLDWEAFVQDRADYAVISEN